MSVIKKKIRLTGNDYNIEIPLSRSNDFTGYQQEIDRYTQIRSSADINGVTDGEITIFNLELGTFTKELKFYFAVNPVSWIARFTIAEFTTTEISQQALNFLNSFFIMDFFDSFDTNNQTKIFSTYLTNLSKNNAGGGGVSSNPLVSIFKMESDFQLFSLNVPKYFVNTGSSSITGYSRFSFYNAKKGNISVFYNQDNNQKTTPEKMYFKTVLNLENKTWNILTPSNGGSDPEIVAYELTNSDQYVEKYNNTFENFDNLQQNYPAGNTFNYENADYE
jgi:hypothetical protein